MQRRGGGAEKTGPAGRQNQHADWGGRVLRLQQLAERRPGPALQLPLLGDPGVVRGQLGVGLRDEHEMDRYSLQESLSGADNEETTTGSGHRFHHGHRRHAAAAARLRPGGIMLAVPAASARAPADVQPAVTAEARGSAAPAPTQKSIYESIKPVGGSGNSPPGSEYRSYNPVPAAPAPPPPSQKPHSDPSPDSQYGFGNLKLEENVDQSRVAARKQRPPSTRCWPRSQTARPPAADGADRACQHGLWHRPGAEAAAAGQAGAGEDPGDERGGGREEGAGETGAARPDGVCRELLQ